MQNKLILVLFAIMAKFAMANCYFQITNDGKYPLQAEVGFYGESSIKVAIKAADTEIALVKSEKDCKAQGNGGIGLAHIDLIGKKSRGGWRYIPAQDMLRAVGASLSGNEGALGLAPDGNTLYLVNNYKPDDKTFSVEVQRASQSISKTGSMD